MIIILPIPSSHGVGMTNARGFRRVWRSTGNGFLTRLSASYYLFESGSLVAGAMTARKC